MQDMYSAAPKVELHLHLEGAIPLSTRKNTDLRILRMFRNP